MPVGPMGGLPRAPRGSDCEIGTTFQNDIVENFILMQIIFAEIFVPQGIITNLVIMLLIPVGNTHTCPYSQYGFKTNKKGRPFPLLGSLMAAHDRLLFWINTGQEL